MRHFPTTNASVTRMILAVSLLWISTNPCQGAESNFEDLDLSVDMPQNEKVEVIQDDPHSNAVHIAHNIPTGSDIYVKQTNPYNASVHISLNVANDCQVRAEMENMVNCALHVSLNGASKSQVDVTISKCFNSSVHLSFQNPVNTPVKLTMDESTQCQIHVSQNVPRNSPMDVTINGAIANEIHCSQSVPQSSPLTFFLDGTIQSNDPEGEDDGDGSANQVEVSQSAADDASPLQCTPECPEPEFVYEYDYYGNGDGSKVKSEGGKIGTGSTQNLDLKDPSDYDFNTNRDESNNEADHSQSEPEIPYSDSSLEHDQSEHTSTSAEDDYSPDYQVPDLNDVSNGEHSDHGNESLVADQSVEDQSSNQQCPGGSLEVCIDVCPGSHPRAFAVCVAECGQRCP
ncbi:uncharacterized protein LOC131890051 isoform X2 [Tigriopus californicus]|uniref:uncharacterized protein LOC131890051 isoform X2 n=1 Tax=Tigriopus californicus TaxID=6832 RepID=UPI0027D9FB3D|nr:uncharacterized protein LOC131890051 isoform X2 [Tigriopus californicus]